MTGINVTPLVDVLLVLVIIFLVLVAVSRRTLPVQLPVAARSSGGPQQILVEILPGAGYRLNGQPVPESSLGPVLQAVLKLRVAKLVFIKPAPERSYQDLITAADIARAAGASIVSVVSP